MKYTIDSHPLKVYYPFGGRHFILRWYNYNRQHSIILARSVEQIQLILSTILDKNFDILIKEGYEINIVAPPISLCEKATILANRELVNQFMREVCFFMKNNVMDKNQQMPSLFMPCNSWSPKKYFYTDDNGSEVEYISNNYEEDDPDHYDCANCELCVKVIGITPDELYDEYHDSWNKTYDTINPRTIISNNNQKIYPKAMYSKALTALSEEDLMFANTDFGPHRNGVCLDKVCPKNIDDILFYFYPVSEIDTTKFVDMAAQAYSEEKKRSSENKFSLQKEKQKKEQNLTEKLIALFDNHNNL